MVHAATSKCSEKNSATHSKNQYYLKVHDAIPSSDGQSICKVKRGCENRDALVKVKSSDIHNKTHQPLYEINAVSEKRIVIRLYQSILLLCKFLNLTLASQQVQRKTKRARQSKVSRGRQLLDSCSANNGSENQLPNRVCVTEDVNPISEMFVLGKEIVLIL